MYPKNLKPKNNIPVPMHVLECIILVGIQFEKVPYRKRRGYDPPCCNDRGFLEMDSLMKNTISAELEMGIGYTVVRGVCKEGLEFLEGWTDGQRKAIGFKYANRDGNK